MGTGTGRGCVGFVPRLPPSLLSSIHALQGDTRWGFQVDSLGLVMDLQVRGTLYVIFSPSVAPYTIASPPFFHSRLHNHCTAHKGLSSQVQPRLARIKESFQLKMFFSSLFFFPQPAPNLFSLFFSCVPNPILTHISYFPSTSARSLLDHILFYVKAGGLQKKEQKAL